MSHWFGLPHTLVWLWESSLYRTDQRRTSGALAGVYPPAWSALGLGPANSERFGLSHQIGQRVRTHLLHNMPAMDLHGNLGKSEFGCYLFVHEAGRYRSQNLSLAGTQGLKEGLQVRDDLIGFAPLPIAFDRHHHS